MILLIILSFIFNIMLYTGIIYEYGKVRKQKDNAYYNLILIISVIVLATIYVYGIKARRMVYTWDYANYYKIQLGLRSYFDDGTASALKSIAGSLLMSDYNCFIGIFCAVLFELFKINSVNGYILAYFFICIIPVIIAFSFMVRKFADKFAVHNTKVFYTITMAVFVFMPLVNYSALLGQPDIFGLVFAMMLIFTALSYDFAKRDIFTWIFLFINTIALMLTRRWYMYWVASFYTVWFITLAITCKVNRSTIKNIFIFATSSIVIGTAGMFPMFKRILLYDYADRYSFYNIGGLEYEIYNQFLYLGLLTCILAAFGFILGSMFKKTRAVAVSTLISIFICMIMITRVQNAAEHQSLIYVTGYILLIMVFLCVIERLYLLGTPGKRCAGKEIYYIIASAVFITVICNAAVSFSGIGRHMPEWAEYAFSNIDTSPVIREDWEELSGLYADIKELLSNGDKMYIVPHGKIYNPDTFRNYREPGSMDETISYGACVLGTHIFPVEFLLSRYIMTCSPIDDLDKSDNSIVKNLNMAVDELASQHRLKLIKEIRFDNGYTFIIYERVKRADSSEINYLKALFWYQSQKYPEDFEKVLDSFDDGLHTDNLMLY